MTDWVLDASAVLALLRAEPGAQTVAAALPHAILSSVNAGEVVTKLIGEGVEARAAQGLVTMLHCPIVSVDAELGLRAGGLSEATARRGLSLGDRVCLALAEREGARALTADRIWADLGLPIEVSLIR